MSGPTRVAVLSSASGGGAGIAALRLAQALEAHPGLGADFIDIARLGESLPLPASPQTSLSNRRLTDTHFTLEHLGYCRGWLVELLSGYDLVNVHWSSYLISLAELHALAVAGRPMLFWLHDFHYITGGCHYPAGCEGFHSDCRGCPQLDVARANPVAVSRALAVKRAIFAHSNVHLTAPSRFLRDQAVAAGIVPAARAHVLRNAYQPLPVAMPERTAARRILLIADSLAEGRKNMRVALQALAALAAAPGTAQVAGAGVVVDIVGKVTEDLQRLLVDLRLPHAQHGRIRDHAALSRLLARADVLLTCSTEDNWPNILVEAGCHGCMPVVGPGHGCAEFVRQYGFGRVAADYAVESFVAALLSALAGLDPAARRAAAVAIRRDHAPERVAAQFIALLGGMIAPDRGSGMAAAVLGQRT